jgi:hypothetical protein
MYLVIYGIIIPAGLSTPNRKAVILPSIYIIYYFFTAMFLAAAVEFDLAIVWITGAGNAGAVTADDIGDTRHLKPICSDSELGIRKKLVYHKYLADTVYPAGWMLLFFR